MSRDEFERLATPVSRDFYLRISSFTMNVAVNLSVSRA